KNPKDVNINIVRIEVTNNQENAFSIIAPVAPVQLRAYDSVPIHIRFHPKDVRTYSARVSFYTPGLVSPTCEFIGKGIHGTPKLSMLYPNGGEAFGLWDTLHFQWNN